MVFLICVKQWVQSLVEKKSQAGQKEWRDDRLLVTEITKRLMVLTVSDWGWKKLGSSQILGRVKVRLIGEVRLDAHVYKGNTAKTLICNSVFH